MWAELGLEPRGADRLARARAVMMWRSPVPPGLRAVHATWIEHGLADLPARAREVVAGAAESPEPSGGERPVDVWLARSATAELPPMIVEPALAAVVGAHAAWKLVEGIPTAPLASLVAWLDQLGAEQLAFATTGASRRFAGTSQRAAIARCSGLPKDELLHVRIAARTVAPRLSSLAAHQLAVRLPRPVGLVMHDELVAHRSGEVPAWPALLA